MGFTNNEKANNRVNKKAIFQVIRMYDMDGKQLNGNKSIYVNILAYVRVKGGMSECFKIDRDVRQVYIMSLWLFNVYMDAVMKELKIGMERLEVRFMKGWERVEITLPLVCR